MNVTPSTTQADNRDIGCSVAESDASCRVPLFVLFVSAAVWLVVASLFELIASIKFHSPNFLAGCAWLTYGRVHAVAINALLYGFAVQAGLGVMLWIITRLARTRTTEPWLIAVGGKLWNIGVTVGVIGILIGSSTGFKNLEMPIYAGVLLFLAYVLMGVPIAMTLHSRRDRVLESPQWFLLAALFWFPWILSTAYWLLALRPVRGMTQAVISWWFSANLNWVWIGLVGLAIVFDFMPRLMNRKLHSQYLALFTFWTLILFGSWMGVPSSAPVPAWIPSLSTVATILTTVTVLSVMVNVYRTCQGCEQQENPPAGKFIAFGTSAFVVAWAMNIVGSLPPVAPLLQFTWFTPARAFLNGYGFFAMTVLGAIYYIVPRVTGIEWPCARSVRAHFWLAMLGVFFFVAPLAIGGIKEGIQWDKPEIPPVDVAKGALVFLRISTLGELLILLGHLLLLANIVRLSVRYYRTYFLPVYREATAELKPVEVKP
jgi:cytochrome c oxidase cbb3-type subunit 1